MKITIGSDHRGYALKEFLKKNFSEFEWQDVGTDNGDRTDYPIFAKKVCSLIRDKKVELGILICGSGVGIAMAANRFSKIYAALCWSPEVARVAREHDYSNVLVLPSDFVSNEDALKIVKAWMGAKFLGGRYQARLDMIDGQV